MARPETPVDEKTVESWEAATDVTVWVWVYDKREDKYKKQRVGGRSGSRMLHIRRDDRVFNQEQVVVENKHLDPFTNGLLRLVAGGREDDELDATYHLTVEDLKGMLEIRDEEIFKGEVEGIGSELILRRLKDAAEKHGAVWQLEFIRDVIDDRYKVGGTQRAERDVYGDPTSSTEIRLS